MSTLARIITKVRRLTGRPSSNQITDEEITEYINTFYQNDFPESIRIGSNYTVFSFTSSAGISSYNLRDMPIVLEDGNSYAASDVYYNLSPPAYIAGYQSFYSQNREQFFRIYPALRIREKGFSLVAQDVRISAQRSISPSTARITFGGTGISIIDLPRDATLGTFQVAPDTPGNFFNVSNGIATSRVSGGTLGPMGTNLNQINYQTGQISLALTGSTLPLSSVSDLSLNYESYPLSRPQAILFFNNVITLRPVPDDNYLVELNAYRIPSSFVDSSDATVLMQWGEYIAYGAAKKVFEDAQDNQGINSITPEFERQESLVLHRHLVQQTNQRTSTVYTDMVAYPYGDNERRF